MNVVELFEHIDLSRYGPFDSYVRPLEQGLYVLNVCRNELAWDKMSADEIASVITEVFGVSMKPGGVTAAFRRAHGKVHAYPGPPCKYRIMKQGVDHLQSCNQGLGEGLQVFLFEAGSRHTSKRTVRGLLSDLQPPICVCDPYCSERTLDVLAELQALQGKVRVLTETDKLRARKRAAFVRSLSDFVTEYPGFEFRDYAGTDLHDRFILSKERLVILGHSIKDVGGKDSFAVALGRDFAQDVYQSTEALFNERWKRGIPIP